ncbi:RNA polymerase subunit sigma-24 [Clostridium thermosuccinogenes]|uniref:RNA polymerase subunit sigma-24 n=1 Tax=Clostridium thermosuccinogenes TaxID=84032 RepID=A0A2K2F869_9CLOT|nr:RNA polymerase sigma factor [Pseudoclostridium thermosuccinogenes]AUS98807.1 RNA polymerase subunit sigma-24 [Pseudoclostridium thermosuccinogenes]PNT94533.1 RNA polymerase subunit sigma-24 [Pseudoclostridium thermosuccinogenes]PNT94965.1 RNA polymerase subunit sigma-24 [Pseudoclostridium thermosuccinogenes]
MLPIYLAMLGGEEDKSKFETLYMTYRKLMFHVANRILNDELLAEDAVHQTFLKILENFDKLEEISCHKTKSYIVTMVRNISINLYNQRKRCTTISFEDVEYCMTTEFTSAVEDLDHLARAVLKLPVIYKEVLTLKYVHDFSNEEIAKMLDVSEAVVRKRLERAKRKIKEILGKEESAHVY